MVKIIVTILIHYKEKSKSIYLFMISMNQHNMKISALKYDNNCFEYEMYENKSLKLIVNRQYEWITWVWIIKQVMHVDIFVWCINTYRLAKYIEKRSSISNMYYERCAHLQDLDRKSHF